MATFKPTNAISASQVAKWLGKITSVPAFNNVTDLEGLQAAAAGDMETCNMFFRGLCYAALVTTRLNVRATMTSLGVKSELVRTAQELCWDDENTEGMVHTPILVCDDSISGIDSLFVVYSQVVKTPEECKTAFRELLGLAANAPGCKMPVVIGGSLKLQNGEFIVIAAIQAATATPQK